MRISKQKKPVGKAYILHDSNCMPFWKRQNHKDSEKVSEWLPGAGGGRNEKKLFYYDIIMVDGCHHIIHLSKSTEYIQHQE